MSLVSVPAWATRHPIVVLVITAMLGGLATAGLTRLHQEDDLMVFLPSKDPDVLRFKEVSTRFGALRVALIGIEAKEGDDVFAPEVIAKIGKASAAMRDLTGVDRVVSLTTTADIVAGPDGAEITPLVAGVPQTEEARAALRKKVLSRDHIVGNVVSADGRATLMMVFLAEEAATKSEQPKALAIEERIRQAATRELSGLSLIFGGAPFAARAIYAEAQADVWRLSPLALALLLGVVLLAFRDLVGVLLTIASVAYAVLIIAGGMGWWGEHWTVATAALPVILFGSGSSYAVNVLGRYYLVRTEAKPAASSNDSMIAAIRIVGPPLTIAAFTTSIGFFCFVATDVRPMRAFGIACGSGVLLCWLVSLTVVPAVISLWPRQAVATVALARLGDAMWALWRWATRRRVLVLSLTLLGGALLLRPMLAVRVRMEPRAFFRKGSDPERAERFLVERFGGATFVQVALRGDFDEPAALREVASLEALARTLPGVTQVQSITGPLSLVSEGMGAGPRLPLTRGQAASLYFFLEGQPELRAFLSEDRKAVLIHVRVADHAPAVVDALEAYARARFESAHGWPARDEVARRIAQILAEPGRPLSDELVAQLRRTASVIAEPNEDSPALAAERAHLVFTRLAAPDAPELYPDRKAAAELAVERQSPGWVEAWRKAAKIPEDVDRAADTLRSDFAELRRRMAVAQARPVFLEAASARALTPAKQRLLDIAIDDLFGPPAEVASVKLSAEIAGEPVLDRGFSRSVEHNQLRSLVVAVLLVLACLLALFRKPRTALICFTPALLTLVYQSGVMGVLGVPIDLGTSLVAGIATGAGSDFAVYCLWHLRDEEPEHVCRSVGPVMLVSILLVALAFVVLALGRSPVMHLFGTLAGGAMALSAFFTCLILPAALGGRRP